MRSSSRLPLFVLAAALLIVFHRLWMGEAFFWGLPSLQFYPWREYAFDLLRAGHLPLWNPLNGAGAPLFANYQSSLLYPLSWPGFVLPLALTMTVTAILHLFIAGWGLWKLGGTLGFSALGRGLSGLAFGMTGYLMARLGTYPMIQAAAWLPWMLWAGLRLLETGRPRTAGRLALFTGLLLLAGHAQTAWYSLLLVGAFALWWTLTHRPFRWRRLVSVIGCLALGAGIAALQLIATAELLSQSQRSAGVAYDFAMNYSYSPARILNLFAPNAFGTPADGSYITGGAFFEDAVYVGLIPLTAALGAVVSWALHLRGRERHPATATVPFWVLVVLIGFVMALGTNTPVFPFLYQHIPTFNLFQGPERWHLWTVVGLSVLAGIGGSIWSRSARRRKWGARATVACGAAMLIALAALIVAPTDARSAVGLLEKAVFGVGLLGMLGGILTLLQPKPDTAAHGRWAFAVLVVVAFDLAWASWGLNPTVPASFYAPTDTPVPQARGYWPQNQEDSLKFERYFRFDNYLTAVAARDEIRKSELPNLNLIDRWPLLNNFEPLLVGHFADYIDLIEANSSDNAALLHGAGVGYTMTQDTVQPVPRAWLVSSVCWHTSQADMNTALSDPAWQPYGQLHMLGDGGCAPAADSPGTVTSLVDNANSVSVSVDAARSGWLVLADTDYPGWHASIDGVETPIYRANLAFRAVQVDSSVHEVRFDYNPPWLLPGALVSMVSLVVAVLLYRLGA
jgi:hypothetical protein